MLITLGKISQKIHFMTIFLKRILIKKIFFQEKSIRVCYFR